MVGRFGNSLTDLLCKNKKKSELNKILKLVLIFIVKFNLTGTWFTISKFIPYKIEILCSTVAKLFEL